MSPVPHYPVVDYGPLMKGMVIGGAGILHVFLAQFAIGGGMLMLYMERLAQRGYPGAREFVASYFKTLVLVSFVLGAVTGVQMWLATIQVGARTIGLMVDEFHWLWATEWACFCLEVVAGYAFLRYGDKLAPRARTTLLAMYAIAAWFSLFWINGILSWQLTPGAWLHGGGVWAGFFNPSFWPSLLYRTVVALTLATLVATMIIGALALERPVKQALQQRVTRLLLPMAAMPLLGVWYLAVVPSDSRSWILGGSVAMMMFLGIAAGASVLIAAYALLGVLRKHLYVSTATAALLLALAFGATAAGEFVREGARKPFTVRGVMYSTSITPDEVAELRQVGAVADDPYPLRDAGRYPTGQLKRGALVERALCDACHTMQGANAIVELSATWSPMQLRLNVAQLQRTKGFMPPFAGNADDVEALVQLILWERAGAPKAWPDTRNDPARAQIAAWLAEAGTEPSPTAPPSQTPSPALEPHVEEDH